MVEAPVLVKHGSHYVLLYSANSYAGEAYAIGYATASSATGPYRKHPVPLLSTSSSKGRFAGPGGQDVVTGPDGHDLLVFHSWDPARVYRGMDVLPLTWDGGTARRSSLAHDRGAKAGGRDRSGLNRGEADPPGGSERHAGRNGTKVPSSEGAGPCCPARTRRESEVTNHTIQGPGPWNGAMPCDVGPSTRC